MPLVLILVVQIGQGAFSENLVLLQSSAVGRKLAGPFITADDGMSICCCALSCISTKSAMITATAWVSRC